MKLLNKNLKLPKLASVSILLFMVCVIALVGTLYYKKNRDGFTEKTAEAAKAAEAAKTEETATNIKSTNYDQCYNECITHKVFGKNIFNVEHCKKDCQKYKPFNDPRYALTQTTETTETFTNQTSAEDLSQTDCLETCLQEGKVSETCIDHCGKWAKEQEKKLESCFFRPGGLTPGDCKTRCADYYKIVKPNDTICPKTCESICDRCDTAQCKWTNFQSEEEFPYQLSIFGVPGNRNVTISWEKPPYAVKKYIIMYFEEEQQHTKGVHFEEKLDYECDPKSPYCAHIIDNLTNNKNYIIGVSVIFQNNNVTRMSNRLVMRPTRMEKMDEETEEKKKETIKQEVKTQTRTPTQILSGALLREKRKANSQKILTDFKKSQEEEISDLFSYLATNPINLQFKLS